MSFHSATILVYFSFRLWQLLRTIILFWCSRVHRLRSILPTKYLSLSKLWSQHADSVILRKKWIFIHLYIVRNIANNKTFYKSYQGTRSFSKFRLSEGTTLYQKSKSSSNLTKKKDLELALEPNAKTLSTLLFDILILMHSFVYRESSKLIDRRYDSRNTFKKNAAINASNVWF